MAPRLTAPVVNLFTLSPKSTFTALFVILKHMSLSAGWMFRSIRRALVEDEACLSGSSDAPALPWVGLALNGQAGRELQVVPNPQPDSVAPTLQPAF